MEEVAQFRGKKVEFKRYDRKAKIEDSNCELQ